MTKREQRFSYNQTNIFQPISNTLHLYAYYISSKIILKTLAFSFYNFTLVCGRNSPYGNATRWQKANFFLLLPFPRNEIIYYRILYGRTAEAFEA